MYKSSKNSIFGNLTNWLLHTLAFNELIFDALDYFHWRSGESWEEVCVWDSSVHDW